MLALPMDRVSRFEEFLVGFWRDCSCSWVYRRDALAVSLGLCGLRWEEVSRVRVCDLDPGGNLDVRSAKGGVRRTIPVGVGVVSALRLLCLESRRQFGEASPVFCVRCSGRPLSYEQIKRRMREWTKTVFGRPFSFHCLRHTAAIRVYRATRDVLAVQRFLGHQSLRWTETYLRSLEVVEVAGLPAFCGPPLNGPRLFDPDGEVCTPVVPPPPPVLADNRADNKEQRPAVMRTPPMSAKSRAIAAVCGAGFLRRGVRCRHMFSLSWTDRCHGSSTYRAPVS